MSRHSWPATVVVVLTCAGLATALSGCGAANIVDPVARAATISNQAPGYRLRMTMRLSSPALASPITATGQGALNVPDHSGSFTMNMNLGNIPQVTQVLGSSRLQIQELTSGTTVYMKLPTALMSRIPLLTKPWLKLDLAQAASAAGIPGLSALTSNPASSDPSQLLRYLRAESGHVTKVGTASVDGFQTTHYRAQINLDRVPNAFPAASRAQVRQTISALERISQVHLLPVNIWIDGHHLVRRMQLAFHENVAGAGPLSTAITIDVPQYGPQPSPSLPPADQVQDISGLAGSSTP